MDAEHALASFVARIWLEHGSNGDSIWRGHIQHVQGKEESYFQDLRGMSEFLERVSGVPGPALTGQKGRDAAFSGAGATVNKKPKN